MIDFFLTGENEAEFKIQDVVFEEKKTKQPASKEKPNPFKSKKASPNRKARAGRGIFPGTFGI